MTRTHKALAAAALALGCAGLAQAQEFPSRAIKIVVPFAPGGAVDSVARVVGARIAEQVHQPVVVENKPGANANLGAQAVVAAPADGYTLLLGANGLATNPTLEKNLPFDPLRDLVPVARVGYAPLVLVVPADHPAKTVQELVSLSKAQPNTFNYGSAAVGGSGHLATELLKSATGLDAQHVAYKGGAPALTDLIGGRLHFMLINPLEAAPHVKAGKLRALAVSSRERIASLPDVPTFEQAGVKGFEATVWWGLLAPAKTPAAIVSRLASESLKALQDPGVREKLEAMGAVVAPQDAQAFGRFLADETQKWAKVIREAKISSD
jgi:tripartite-type tricarboxylate transporter receptor subunit TctC